MLQVGRVIGTPVWLVTVQGTKCDLGQVPECSLYRAMVSSSIKMDSDGVMVCV